MIFCLIINIIVLLACGGLDILITLLEAWFNSFSGASSYAFVYGSNYILRIAIISCILTLLMTVLKIRFKTRKKIIFYIIPSLMTLGFIISGLYIISNKAEYVFNQLYSLGEYIKNCSVFVVPLLLQTNLFIYFIKANKDYFKKKSTEISDSKE